MKRIAIAVAALLLGVAIAFAVAVWWIGSVAGGIHG